MKQMNLQLTKEFLKDLKAFMQLSGIHTKSEAIRVAVRKCVIELLSQKKKTDFRGWLGIGLRARVKENRRFKNEDDLWEK